MGNERGGLVRARGRVAAAAVAALCLAALPGTPASAQAATRFGDFDFEAAATATVVHTDAVQTGTTRVANIDEAFAGATVDSRGVGDTKLNEMARPYQTAQGDKRSYGRGSGLEVGVLQESTTQTPTLTQAALVETSAGPGDADSGLQQREVGPVDLDPVAYASLLRGQSRSRWSDNDCILGSDLSFGLGFAADAQLLDLGTQGAEGPELEGPLVASDHPNPDRRVAQSLSRTRLVPQAGPGNDVFGSNFGLMAESRQTIAPVTLFKGQPNQLTIEVLGEWVLQAVATGVPGRGFVHYGPGTVSPETPILRTIDANNQVTNLLTFQQITGQQGVVVNVPGIAEIAIGEDPRAIGGDAASQPAVSADGTSVAAAVDVVRIRVLGAAQSPSVSATQAVDLRVGHMEVSSRVPAGGITCNLRVTKDANPDIVGPGDEFTYTINAVNPFDCELTNVRVEDTIEAPSGIRFTVVGTEPPATSVNGNRFVFENLPNIPPRSALNPPVRIRVRVEPGSAPGRMVDIARVSGNCAVGTGRGDANVVVPVTGEVRVVTPEIVTAQLPRTGGPAPLAAIGLASLVAGLGARRLRRRALI